MENEHYQARGMFESVDINGEALKIPAIVPKLEKTPGETCWAGPSLGESNDDIYSALLGLREEEIADLRKDEVI